MLARHRTDIAYPPRRIECGKIREAYLRRRFEALLQRFKPTAQTSFAYFSAFDAPWRVSDVSPVPGQHPEEAHFGLFDAQRKPKLVVQSIPRISTTH